MKGRKLLLSVCLMALIAVVCLLALPTQADAATEGYYTYMINNGEATITDCDTAASGAITIPAKLGGYPVTGIGNWAFAWCDSLTTVTIPKGVTSIGADAFYACTSLTSVTIPYGVTSIGAGAFSRCSSLTSVTIPDGVTSISGGMFSSCSKLTTVNIPMSVTSIGSKAFSSCAGLTSVTIPESVTSIGNGAFYECSSLTSVTIPDGVNSIGAEMFKYCYKLTSVTIPESVASIGAEAFCCCYKLTTVTIPEGVTSIGDYAFYYCSSLSSVTIPGDVKTIGWFAFSGCDNLQYNTYRNGQYLGNANNPYVYLADATSITTGYIIHPNTRFIGTNAFYNCTNLTSINIPEGVLGICYRAFYCCNKLTSITIPDGVTRIDSFAFYDCSSLTSVAIPDSVTSIGSCVFSGCSNLTSVTLPESVSSISASMFYNCKALSDITIPDSVTCIDNFAFYDCSSLTSITIPNGVTSIGDSAFRGCVGLTSITIPEGVTEIVNDAFYECTGLTDITLPMSVIVVKNDAFECCTAIKDVWYIGTQEDAAKIELSSGNDCLISAQWHYNTCSENGKHTYTNDCDTTCNGCEFIRMITHDYQWIVDREGNCGADGIKHQECSVCHIEQNENTIITATGNHSYDDVCDVDCNVCGNTRTAPHQYEWVVDKENNCGESGLKHQQCQLCQVVSDENTVINATGNHSYTWVIDKEASCGYDGSKHEECRVCGKEQNANTVIAATGKHNFTDADDLQCDVCMRSFVIISFETFGGSEIQQVRSYANKSVTLPTNIPTKSGYVFTGWSTSRSGDVKYEAGDTVPALNKSMVLYAQWDKSCSKYERIKCLSCNGKGGAYGNVTCSGCDGSKKVYTTVECTTCGADGRTSKTCTQCGGEGKTWRCSTCETQTGMHTLRTKTCDESAHKIYYGECFPCWGKGKVTVDCSQCEGNGYVYQYVTCDKCSGTGKEQAFISCKSCSGSGTIRVACSQCGGTGTISRTEVSPPNAPVLKAVSADAVELKQINGCEYSINGVDWQDSPVFEDLVAGRTYSLYQRYAKTETTYASAASDALQVTTHDHTYDNRCDTTCNDCGMIRSVPAHCYTNYKSNNDATCTENGTKTAKCDYCGVTGVREDEESALGHSFTNYKSNNDATCLEDGTKTAKCDRCEATDTQIDEKTALDHSFTNYKSNNDATCLEDGTKTAKCDRCSETDTKPDTDSALGHSFTNYLSNNDATCVKDGTKTAKCDRCPRTDTKDDTDSALGHSFTDYVSNNDATCLEDGTKTAKCDRCEETDTQTDDKSALGHSFTNYVSDNNATYDADGTKTAKCDRCEATDTIPDPGTKLIRMVGISITTKPNKLVYNEGDAFDPAGMVVTLHYENGTSETITDYTISGYSSTPGTKTIKVTYKGLSTTFTVTVNEKVYYFPDVSKNAWYYNAVQFAVKKGYFSGHGNGNFGPDEGITRQDFVVVLSRIEGADLSKYSGQTSFRDVPANAYYAKAIHWASSNQVVMGYNDTEFGVDDQITREQLVTILYRYAMKKGCDMSVTGSGEAKLNSFADKNKVGTYAKPACIWALEKGVLSGKNPTTFDPTGTATRAEVAQILMNISVRNIIPFK